MVQKIVLTFAFVNDQVNDGIHYQGIQIEQIYHEEWGIFDVFRINEKFEDEIFRVKNSR